MQIVFNEEDIKKLKNFKHLKYSDLGNKTENEIKEQIIFDISHLNTILMLSFENKEEKKH
jgi:hypothetical protein